MTKINAAAPQVARVDSIEDLKQLLTCCLKVNVYRGASFKVAERVIIEHGVSPIVSSDKALKFAVWRDSIGRDFTMWVIRREELDGFTLSLELTSNDVQNHPDGIAIPLAQFIEQVRSAYSGAQLLADYETNIQQSKQMLRPDLGQEAALLSLLKAEIENKMVGGFDFSQPHAGEIFHKQFRQFDVCSGRGVDMAVWQLLTGCPLFWEVLSAKAPEVTA